VNRIIEEIEAEIQRLQAAKALLAARPTRARWGSQGGRRGALRPGRRWLRRRRPCGRPTFSLSIPNATGHSARPVHLSHPYPGDDWRQLTAQAVIAKAATHSRRIWSIIFWAICGAYVVGVFGKRFSETINLFRSHIVREVVRAAAAILDRPRFGFARFYSHGGNFISANQVPLVTAPIRIETRPGDRHLRQSHSIGRTSNRRSNGFGGSGSAS
jgi:hypothetical protein